VIILKIDIENVALVAMLEAEYQSPIAADRHGEAPVSISDESMKSARAAQITNASRAIYRVED
jgi:hypothetical protein